MKTKSSIIIIACSLLLLNGCLQSNNINGDGDLVTHQISIEDYQTIEAAGISMTIEYIQSDEKPFLQVTTDRNIYEKYEFEIHDHDKLRIRPKKKYRNRHNFNPTEFKVITNSRNLEGVKIAGDTELHINSPLNGHDLKMEMAGKGSINLHDTVTLDRLKLSMAGSVSIIGEAIYVREFRGGMAGSGTMTLGGRAEKADLNIAGKCNVHGFEFEVDELDCKIAGSGNIEIYANRKIHASTAGSGKIRYKGNPEDTKSDALGSGTIEKVD